ncbi:TIGR00153 family protein [Catenovulum sp. SM1970]|uniref:TIGR00153 family protein n=1 Tax=Marinifaba aquimaris TaxID=2741323 RepID=UPI00157289FF|nr:TIGR00153 family protein [Marinifaba aquimaris]NTS78332.1 TIGR00153 family protein [Marinifaba aquimaris]
MSSNSILGVFAKSPFKPLEQHIDTVLKASELLLPFFEAVYQKNWEKAEQLRQQISDTEREADKQKQSIRINLPKGLFLPIERTDLLELLTQQDKIANKAKDIAGRIIGRELNIPSSLQQDFTAYVTRSIDAVKHAAKAIHELDELLETGFRGREVDFVEKIIHQLAAIEEDTDRLQITIRKQLHQIEHELNPIDAIFLYSVIEWVGELADKAESVGSRLELLLAR